MRLEGITRHIDAWVDWPEKASLTLAADAGGYVEERDGEVHWVDGHGRRSRIDVLVTEPVESWLACAGRVVARRCGRALVEGHRSAPWCGRRLLCEWWPPGLTGDLGGASSSQGPHHAADQAGDGDDLEQSEEPGSHRAHATTVADATGPPAVKVGPGGRGRAIRAGRRRGVRAW